MEYVAETGEKFTDEDVLRWAADAEAGFPNSTIEWVPGRTWETKREPMRTKSIRAPQAIWTLAAQKAASEGISESEWIRNTLTRAVLT